ncbi:MAG TPA: redoxin domain-containing protein [Sandaracinaceae bacterium LLY-WYZ-13_1]|nr:redoxin domain-containing protein [Sandaracinaceae bacterium LLY-WYZ-13_1]
MGVLRHLLATVLAWLSLAAPAEAQPEAPDEAGGVARVLLFTAADCPHCQRVKHEVVPALEARFGERLDLREREIADPSHYEALMAIEDAHGVPYVERVVPTAVLGEQLLGGADAIERGLADAIAASLVRGGNPWPSQVTVEADAALDAAPDDADDAGSDDLARDDAAAAGASIWLAYVYQTGCQECSRARRDLDWVAARHPRVRIETHNVYDDADLAFWMAERAGRELEVPAVFVGDDALVGPEEVEARAVARLVERHAEGAPRFWAGYEATDGAPEVVERFRSLGPLAVITAGLVDGINPCAFATLIFFVSYLSVSGRRGREVLAAGGAFTVGVFLAYLLVGLGLYRLLDLLGGALTAVGRGVMIGTAILCAVLAVLSLRDFALARRGRLKDMTLTLPTALRDRIHAVIRRGKSARFYVAAAFGTGLVVSLLELACTGQVYLPTIIFVTSVPELRAAAVGYLVLYNLLFVLPLVVVFVLVYLGTTSKQLTGWLKRHAKGVKLGLAVFFAVLAGWLVVAAVPPSADAQPRAPLTVGDAPPALELEWVVGEGPDDLAALRGRPSVVLFFSAVCPACRRALDDVDALARREGAPHVIGVSEDHPPMLRGLFGERPVGFPVARDAGDTFDRWGITRVPTVIVLDGRGRVRAVLIGGDGLRRLPAALRRLRR